MIYRRSNYKITTKDKPMKNCKKFHVDKLTCTLFALITLCGCATPPPAVTSASLNGAKRVAIVNIAQSELLMLGARNNPSQGPEGYIGTGRSGIIVGALMNEALANNWAGNRQEFNARAPTNLAKDLQTQFTKLMQSEVAATGREAIIVDIKTPDRRDQNYWQLMIKSVREQCMACDHALIVSSAFGYTKGDRVLNPTAESTFLTARLADAIITGDTPFLIQRDFSNSAAGHEHYNDFRNDKRDHYVLLRDLPAVAARAIAKELR
jgi:hypothetical protein